MMSARCRNRVQGIHCCLPAPLRSFLSMVISTYRVKGRGGERGRGEGGKASTCRSICQTIDRVGEFHTWRPVPDRYRVTSCGLVTFIS